MVEDANNGERHPKLVTAARSDTGRSRKANQDYAYAGGLPGSSDWTLLAVADGLGGHARGEWASQRAIELVAGELGGLLAELEPPDALKKAIESANAAIHHEGQAMGAAGAATTLVCALIRGREAWWANVGDSRIYRSHRGSLTQVSNDHSWVAEQVRTGRLTESALKAHPEKNVVTRTVGFEPQVAPEVGGPLLLREGEALVLCSDGLHGPVPDDLVARAVSELEPEHAAERLIELANEAGGPDNITVVIGRMEAGAVPAARTELTEQPVPPPAKGRRKPLRRVLWAGFAALLSGAALAVPAAVFLLHIPPG